MEIVVRGTTKQERYFDCERTKARYSRRLYCGAPVRKGLITKTRNGGKGSRERRKWEEKN